MRGTFTDRRAVDHVKGEYTMASIPKNHLRPLLNALVELDIFDSKKKIDDIFASNPYLQYWNNRIPWAEETNRLMRINIMISFLINKKHPKGAYALATFLEVVVLQYKNNAEVATHIAIIEDMLPSLQKI